jgi:hypothetical protein
MRLRLLLVCLGCFAAGPILVAADPQEPALYPIKRRGRTGFIDRQGKLIIEPLFDLARDIES